MVNIINIPLFTKVLYIPGGFLAGFLNHPTVSPVNHHQGEAGGVAAAVENLDKDRPSSVRDPREQKGSGLPIPFP